MMLGVLIDQPVSCKVKQRKKNGASIGSKRMFGSSQIAPTDEIAEPEGPGPLGLGDADAKIQ